MACQTKSTDRDSGQANQDKSEHDDAMCEVVEMVGEGVMTNAVSKVVRQRR
jgi:hypothetical protein